LRAEAREREKGSFVISSFNKAQVIFTRDSREYALDRLGQLVPRLLVRNISIRNEQELRAQKAIWASGHGPLGAVKASEMSGTEGNVITQPSQEMAHVQGSKPSDFLSATTSAVGAVNSKGQAFGDSQSGSRVTAVTIDLAHISPQDIRAVYTEKGIGYWMLQSSEATRPLSLPY
jgi:hypothetical protein